MNIEALVNAILLQDWDPLTIKNEPRAQDEYVSYGLEITALLNRGTSEDELTIYLENVVVNFMELNSNEAESRAIAKKLLSVALSRPSKS